MILNEGSQFSYTSTPDTTDSLVFSCLPDDEQRLFLNFFNEICFLEYMINSKDAAMSKW